MDFVLETPRLRPGPFFVAQVVVPTPPCIAWSIGSSTPVDLWRSAIRANGSSWAETPPLLGPNLWGPYRDPWDPWGSWLFQWFPKHPSCMLRKNALIVKLGCRIDWFDGSNIIKWDQIGWQDGSDTIFVWIYWNLCAFRWVFQHYRLSRHLEWSWRHYEAFQDYCLQMILGHWYLI